MDKIVRSETPDQSSRTLEQGQGHRSKATAPSKACLGGENASSVVTPC